MDTANFIISKVFVLSKNEMNDFPLIDCSPTAFTEIFSVGWILIFFSPRLV